MAVVVPGERDIKAMFVGLEAGLKREIEIQLVLLAGSPRQVTQAETGFLVYKLSKEGVIPGSYLSS